jgi:hypothetical protein
MELIIHSYEGVEIPGKGLMRFGMSREEVRGFFEEKPKELHKQQNAKVPTDSFRDSYVLCYYDDGEKLDAVEVGYLTKIILHSKNLFLFETIEELKKFLNDLGGNLIPYANGYDSRSLGISIYSPDPNQIPVEGVMIFRRGYL